MTLVSAFTTEAADQRIVYIQGNIKNAICQRNDFKKHVYSNLLVV